MRVERKVFAKRFGAIAIERGFISEDQLNDAVEIQIELDLIGTKKKAIGEILIEKGYMSHQQVNEVLGSLGK